MKFLSLFTFATAAAGSALLPTSPLDKRQALTTSQTGMSNGYYFSFWTDGAGQVSYTNGQGGQYSATWGGNAGNWVGGKGWAKGEARDVTYQADYNPNGNSYLALYGWTRSPLIEYYVVENYGTYNPSSAATKIGSVQMGGGTYDLLQTTRTNAPSIDGTQNFQQYWAVRTDKRTSGTISTKTIFDAWAAAGLKLGTHDYQILATEGYQSSGKVTVTVG